MFILLFSYSGTQYKSSIAAFVLVFLLFYLDFQFEDCRGQFQRSNLDRYHLADILRTENAELHKSYAGGEFEVNFSHRGDILPLMWRFLIQEGDPFPCIHLLA